jgi:hypothetical protein
MRTRLPLPKAYFCVALLDHLVTKGVLAETEVGNIIAAAKARLEPIRGRHAGRQKSPVLHRFHVDGEVEPSYLPMSSINMSMHLIETLGLLPEARRFVAEGERLVSEQRALVRVLERRGYDTFDAIEHLELLEVLQADTSSISKN